MSDMGHCKGHWLMRMIPEHDRSAVISGHHNREALRLTVQATLPRCLQLALLSFPQPSHHLAHHPVYDLQEADLRRPGHESTHLTHPRELNQENMHAFA
eukprot:1136662-Pelagomonas_calceolata.AAC.5